MDRPPVNASDIDPDAVFAHCAAIAARNDSPLWLVGRALPEAKRRFFAAAYASMRLIDDFVDDEFLALAPADRAAQRAAAHEKLAHWATAVDAAAAGKPPATAKTDGQVFQALARTLPHSDLGTAPWHALAAAMRQDVDEQPIADWAGFSDYCAGATVAPATIFVYILACRADGALLRWPLDRPPAFYARDIAVFCYLVHIMRDLASDAAGDAQLLTIPRAALAFRDLTPAALRDAIAEGNPGPVVGLVEDLAARAARHRDTAELRIDALSAALDPTALQMLVTLYDAYRVLHGRIAEDPAIVLRDADGLRQFQRSVLRRTWAAAASGA